MLRKHSACLPCYETFLDLKRTKVTFILKTNLILHQVSFAAYTSHKKPLCSHWNTTAPPPPTKKALRLNLVFYYSLHISSEDTLKSLKYYNVFQDIFILCKLLKNFIFLNDQWKLLLFLNILRWYILYLRTYLQFAMLLLSGETKSNCAHCMASSDVVKFSAIKMQSSYHL